MDYIGEQLKKLRELKGLSVEDVQDATKIRTWYIKAIEEGNLDKLPGKFYEKAFIKSYSELVDLDPAIYNEYLETLLEENNDELIITDNYYKKENFFSKLTKWLSKSLVYILIILIIFIIYLFITLNSNHVEVTEGDIIANNRPDYTSENNNNITPPITNENDIIDQVKISKLATSTNESENYEITYKNTDLSMILQVTGPCWVSIKEEGVNGKEILARTLKQGEVFEAIKLDKPIYLHVGNAKNLKIIINEEIISLGEEETVKYILLQPKEIQ